MSFVLIDEKKVFTDQLNSSYVQSLLKSLHLRGGKPRPVCLCRGQTKKLELYVCKTSRYFLKKMPRTGQDHRPACTFYAPCERHSGIQGYTAEALVINGDNVSIKVNLPITQSSAKAIEIKKTRAKGEKHIRQNKLTMSGIFSVLWEQAEINVWKSEFTGKRSWGAVYKRLSDVANRTVVNRVKLSEIIYMPSPFWRENTQLFTDYIHRLGMKKKYGFLLGEIDSIEQYEYSPGVKISRLNAVIFLKNEVFEQIQHSFKRELSILNSDVEGENKDRVFGLFYVEGVKKSHGWGCSVHQVKLFRTSVDFIPVDSSHESRVVRKMVDEGRNFIKPLRYDADENAYFPDFILTDTGNKETLCEVWGLTDQQDYAEHMQEKIDYYHEQNLPLWEWDAVYDDSIPAFPAKLT